MSRSPRSIRVRRGVMDILADLNRSDRITVLVSLHQVEYALRYCPRTIALRSGEFVYDGPSTELTPALLTWIYGADNDELFVPEPVAAMRAQRPAMPGAQFGLTGPAPDTVPAAGTHGHPVKRSCSQRPSSRLTRGPLKTSERRAPDASRR
jgi:phosphonate transport system ATP-binding protein